MGVRPAQGDRRRASSLRVRAHRSSLPTASANRVGLLMTVPDTPLTLSVSLFDPEADEEGPDCEHRDEHAEDDARSDQVCASESVHE